MAVSGTNLTNAGSTTGATSYATASVTPGANRLILVTVVSSQASPTTVPTLSGNGLTWVQVATVEQEAGALDFRVTVFRAMGSSPSAGAITIDFGANSQSGCAWSVDEFAGVDTTGTDGENAVRQPTTNTGSGTSITVTLGAFASADNGTFGGFGVNANEVQSPGDGFTELGDAGHSAPTRRVETEWRADNDTSVDESSASSVNRAGVALELVASAATGKPWLHYAAQMGA